MSLQMTCKETESVCVLQLEGELSVSEAPQLADRFRELQQQGRNRVVLDLGGVGHIDSTGLGHLVMGFTAFRKAGGSLKLLNLNQRSIELLVLTKLSTVFEIFTDERDAVNSFFPDRKINRFDILSFVQQQKKQRE